MKARIMIEEYDVEAGALVQFMSGVTGVYLGKDALGRHEVMVFFRSSCYSHYIVNNQDLVIAVERAKKMSV